VDFSVVSLAIAAYLALLKAASLAARALRFVKLASAVDRIYAEVKSRGDAVHIAYGAFTGEVLARSVLQSSLPMSAAGFVLVLLYLAYQYADRGEGFAKDIAVYAGTVAITLSLKLGIPFQI
jgi:hypothetical protein